MDTWWQKPGYENLLVYKLATKIGDLNVEFCRRYLANEAHRPYQANRRTIEQMEQAGRSGKQNIVEGSLERSSKGYIKLLGVSRGSFGELLEDYKDYLRQNKLPTWDKNDPRALRIRTTNKADQANEVDKPYKAYTNDPEYFANLMITLINQENYLLDQLLRKLEKKFVEEGGYSENLSRQRKDHIKNRDLIERQRRDNWLKAVNEALKAGKNEAEALAAAKEYEKV